MSWFNSFKHRVSKAWNCLLSRLMLPLSPAHHRDYEQLSSTLDAIPDLMFELDEEGRHHDFRALRKELLVAPPEALLGRTVTDVMPPEAAKSVMEALKTTIKHGYSEGTHIFLPTPMGDRWFEVSMARKQTAEGEPTRFIALSRDITDRKEQQLHTERLAYIDTLTELPNRKRLEERLQEASEHARKAGQIGALLFLDLDKFKQLNDTKGHHVGDLLLKMLAKRLRSSVRQSDLVSRWGGDEFIVMLQNLGHDRSQVTQRMISLCNELSLRLNTPYELEGHQYRCSASIGIYLFEGHENSIHEIIQHADAAMYSAKQDEDRPFVFSNS